jgi:hypothetical protein
MEATTHNNPGQGSGSRSGSSNSNSSIAAIPAHTVAASRPTKDQCDKIAALQQRMRDHYNPLPPQLINLMRILPRRDGDAPELDPAWFYCACFLLSREWDVSKAFAMMQEVVAYRAANQLDAQSQLPPAVSVRGWGDTTAVYTALGKTPRHVPGRAERIAAGVSENLACGVHYLDKGGRPVVYVMIDSLDERGLINTLKRNAKIGQKPADVLWEYAQHFIGVGEDLVLYELQKQQQREMDTKTPGNDSPTTASAPVTAGFAQGLITLVMDLRGFHMGLIWKPMLDLFRDVARELFQYYPDMVHRVIVVNAPSLVRVAFSMVKAVMPLAFQKKISFVGPQQTLTALTEEISADSIPAFLGGRCRCNLPTTPDSKDVSGDKGSGCSCIEGYDRSNPRGKKSKEKKRQGGVDLPGADTDGDNGNKDEEGDENTASTEDVSLSARQRHRRVFALRPSETVVWEFAVPHGCNEVAFAVYFVPQAAKISRNSDNAATVNWAKMDQKQLQPYQVQESNGAQQADAFTATEKGTLVLSWRNTRSWLKTQTLQLRVYKDIVMPSETAETWEEGNAPGEHAES